MGSDLIGGEINVIENFIKDNDIIFDVGSYVGEWSEEVLKRHKNIFIHQFEPSEKSFKTLKEKYKNMGNIFSNNILLSNNEDIVDFYFYENLPVLSTMYRRNQEIEKRHSLNPLITKIKSVSIDKYCIKHNILHINFLKIDTEGCEFNVIRGAENMLNNKKIDFIQFEYGGCFQDASITLKEVHEYLSFRNYKIFKINNNNLLEISEVTSDIEQYDYSNFFCKLT